jgi:hypothetical protein
MDSWKEMDNITFEMTCLEILYSSLSKENRALITFPRYVVFRKTGWRKWDILHGIIITDKNKKETARWMEEQRSPMPSRSTQPCYSCKGLWEPDHRCRGKDKKQIIEVDYDSDDEDLEQSDGDSDSFTKADDSSTLEKDSDPCVLDRQSREQDDGTSISANISHGFSDLAPQ